MPSTSIARNRAARFAVALAVAGSALLGSSSGARADERVCTIPGGTLVKFHTLAPVSSNASKSGSDFAFVLIAPVGVGDCSIPADGTRGVGTIVLAGKAGIHGHEGDLTLTLDTLRTVDGRLVTFDDQVMEINGGNKKVEAGALNFVPDAGIAANLIRGKDVTVDPATPVTTTLLHAAYVTRGDPEPESQSPAP